jgi:ectoine hydroxylase-related dioxygenase (phytanoyl-CoA dioxygenase family)
MAEAVLEALVAADDYNEEWYLERYPDVAKGVEQGHWASGYAHFCRVGRERGRLGVPQIDESWYLNAYPLAAQEIASGKARNCNEHFFKFGRHRGYLIDRAARRPHNAAHFQSKFGGLWTDQKNAMDLVAGRLELGKITESDAELLTKWIQDGYIVLKGAIDDEMVQRALDDLDKAYDGKLPNLKFAVHGAGQRIDWVPEAMTNPTKALDIHWLSPAIRDLIFAPKVLDFMHLVFERRALASQTLGFLRGSAQDAHQDSAYVNYTLPMQFVASWIALEDVTAGAGELFYYVGSHRMPEFVYGGEYKGAEEARRLGATQNLDAELKAHVKLIPEQANKMGLKKERLIAKRGDVLFWSADLAHGGSPISGDHTRKSVVTHYCPAEIMPTYVDSRNKVVLRSHKGLAYYLSSHYGEIEPT